MVERKRNVVIAVVAILVLANVWPLAQWVTEAGLVDVAQTIRAEFLTGTAITIIAVLAYLLPDRSAPSRQDRWPFD